MVIDERINDIYFANGMMIERWEADKSLDLIRNATLRDIYNNNLSEMKREARFDLLYNHSHGIFEDLLESFQQKRAEHKYYWLAADTIASMACGMFKSSAILKSLSMSAADIWLDLKQEELDMPMLKNVTESILSIATLDACGTFTGILGATGDYYRSEDTQSQYDNITGSIKSGHNVIVMAHSQGNFYFNEIYSKVVSEQSTYWMAQYIKAIAIASPANNAKYDSPKITYDNDPVTNIPDRITNEIKNPLRYMFPVNVNEDSTVPGRCASIFYLNDDPSNECSLYYNLEMKDMKSNLFHDFNFYMQENLTSSALSIPNPSRNIIIDFLKESIDNNRKSPSQWNVKPYKTEKQQRTS